MSETRSRRVRQLFDAAMDCSPEDRERWLDLACSEDVELREEVLRLLRVHDESEQMLQPPDDQLGRALMHNLEGGLRQKQADPSHGLDLRPGGRLGEFELLRELGRGGMGVVWEANEPYLKRKVALKVLASHLRFDDDASQRFLREGEAGSRVQHPCIVGVHSAGETGGLRWIAQELVEGGRTLADDIRERREAVQTPDAYYREVCELFRDLARGLESAHAVGVIHRDIKPSNILLTADGEPKIVDFGLAHVEDALALSRTGEFFGTPFYMSPEQAATNRVPLDHRTDIFSLGATLYEALTLSRPFDGDTSHEVLAKILLADPPDPRKLRERVPVDLAVICTRCMAKDPNARYASMARLADDLERHLRGEPIRARPPSRWTLARRWVRRHPVVAVAIAMSALAFVGTSFGLARAARANERVSSCPAPCSWTSCATRRGCCGPCIPTSARTTPSGPSRRRS